MYLREILRECHFEQTEPTMVYEDKRACLLISENPVVREKSRHVDPIQWMVAEMSRHIAIRYMLAMFVRELVGLGVI